MTIPRFAERQMVCDKQLRTGPSFARINPHGDNVTHLCDFIG